MFALGQKVQKHKFYGDHLASSNVNVGGVEGADVEDGKAHKHNDTIRLIMQYSTRNVNTAPRVLNIGTP
jgi:hypothetical protein